MTREEALDVLNYLTNCEDVNTHHKEALEIAIEALEQQKTGHWVDSKDWKERSYDSMYFRKHCSLCNGIGNIQDKFCSNCGAKMVGDTDGNS